MQVDWDSEKDCFDSFSKEMSEFYAIKKSLFASSSEKTGQVSTPTVNIYILRVFLFEAIDVINKNHQNMRQILEKQFRIQLHNKQ